MLVGAIQFCPVFKDKANNLIKLTSLVVEAATHGAKLVVLPELCATGYSFMSNEYSFVTNECSFFNILLKEMGEIQFLPLREA